MLKGKRALVTGSTSGIGLGIARALAAEGAQVMINGFGDAATLEALKKEFPAYHGADMTKPAEIHAMVRAATEKLGGVDILVNNAGIQHTAPIESFPPERWDAIIAINLSSSFHSIQAALPQMKQRNWGRIVNIASVHGLVASVNKVGYIAAKHGLVGLTKVVALENATTGITCNAICPGWVLTPILQKQIDARAAERKIAPAASMASIVSEKMPSQSPVAVEDIGALTVFLCSEAAAQIRGAALPIDGAWTAQ